jgi:hypothetical protein
MMIEIPGLSDGDRRLCDLLWACDTVGQVQVLIQTLTPEQRIRAHAMSNLLIAHALDSVTEIQPELSQYLRSL